MRARKHPRYDASYVRGAILELDGPDAGMEVELDITTSMTSSILTNMLLEEIAFTDVMSRNGTLIEMTDGRA